MLNAKSFPLSPKIAQKHIWNIATLNHVSFESFRRSSPSPPPKHPLKMKSTNPIVQYFPAIFCTPGAIPDWKVEDSWLFLFNWKLLGRPFSSPQYWQGEKLIKVLHFQIYWKCLRALSIALSKRELRNTKQSTKQKRASYRHPLNWEKIVPRQGECLNPIPSLHSLTC